MCVGRGEGGGGREEGRKGGCFLNVPRSLLDVLCRRNSHGVSRQTIERMMERYEKNVTVESILRSQQPPDRREPPLVRGRWVGGEEGWLWGGGEP